MQKKTKPTSGETTGIQAGPKVIEVTFALERAEAREVYLCGDFNSWSPKGMRMIRRDGNGRWEKRLRLPPGRCEYKFVVDDEWVADPDAGQDVINAYGSINSVREVPS